MEVKVGEILEFSAVYDETVSVFDEVETFNQELGCCVDIRQEIGIRHRVEGSQGRDWLFGHEQDMQRVGRVRMVKSQQRGGLA